MISDDGEHDAEEVVVGDSGSNHLDRRRLLKVAAGIAAFGGIGSTFPGLMPAGGATRDWGRLREADEARKASTIEKSVSLMLDFGGSADNVFVDLADRYGYLAEAGIKLVISNPPSALNEIPTLVGVGQFDIGMTVVPSAILARLSGAPIKAIASYAKRSDGLIFYPEGKIKSPKDLVGQTVATYSSVDYIGFLTSYMKSAGLPLSKVNVETVDYTPPLIAAGKVFAGDGLKWGEFVATQHLTGKAPGFVSFFPTSAYGIPEMYGNLMVTSEAFASKNGHLLRQLLVALMRGMRRSLTDLSATRHWIGPWDATTSASTINNKMEQFHELQKYSFFGTNQNPLTAEYGVQSLPAYDAVVKWLHGLKLIKSNLAVDDWVTNEFLTPAAIHPRL